VFVRLAMSLQKTYEDSTAQQPLIRLIGSAPSKLRHILIVLRGLQTK
jgi:hypothetical protein